MLNTSAISRNLMVLILLALLVVGIVASISIYYSALANPSKNASNTISFSGQNISGEVYSHWNYVSEKNLSSLFSQYSTEYQAVWFYFNVNESLSALNGKHDCNPAGGLDCSYNVKTAWQTFFNETPAFSSHIVCNYSLAVQLGERILVSATVWFEASNQSQGIATLEVPYQIDFELVNGSYQLWKEYFGIANDPVVVFSSTKVPNATNCS
jgi:hypothetical protein